MEGDIDTEAVSFIVAALSSGWEFSSVDRAVSARFPDLVGPDLGACYRAARDELHSAGWRYAYRRRSGPIARGGASEPGFRRGVGR